MLPHREESWLRMSTTRRTEKPSGITMPPRTEYEDTSLVPTPFQSSAPPCR